MRTESKLRRAPFSWRACAYVIIVIFAALTVFPMAWLGYSSLKPNEEIVKRPLALPQNPSFANYAEAWEKGGLGPALLNSVVYTAAATSITLFLAMSAAFGLAKFHFKSAKFFQSAFALGLMITVHAVIIPLFLFEVRMGLINTRLGVILPYVAFDLPMSVLIALSFVKGIPDAIIESAEIDGAHYRKIFWSLVMPLFDARDRDNVDPFLPPALERVSLRIRLHDEACAQEPSRRHHAIRRAE